MDRALRDQVVLRANGSCEYCQFPQAFEESRHQLDHVIAQVHDGQTELANLALACFPCNNHKGTNLAGVDPETKNVVRLYHPRQDAWGEHFAWNGGILNGLTAVGRATIAVLRINQRHRVAQREALIAEGVFPPK